MEALAITTSEWIFLASYFLITISDYRTVNNQNRWKYSTHLAEEKDVNYG
jgi:hypothetical protein